MDYGNCGGKMRIRKANSKDINEIIELAYKLVSYEREIMNFPPIDKKDVESKINLDFIYFGDLDYFVCEVEGKIVAIVRIEMFEESAKISEAYVEKEYRNKGIMTMLFEKCVDWARERNVKEFYLTIVENNKYAYDYWMNLGFYRMELRSKLRTLKRNVDKDIVK